MDAIKRGALIGMILGDGYVKKTKYTGELAVLHSLAQRDYCEHKAARVRQILGGQFTVREYNNGPGGKYRAVKFCSSHKYWANLRDWCYPNGRKTFTRKILDMLTPEGIAIWYMDDGTARRNISKDGWVKSVSTSIATMCPESECMVIQDYFQEVHGIEFKIRRRAGSPEDRAYFIECNTANSRLFVTLIQPYIIPSMLYKIAHVADLSSHECRAPVGTCQNCDGVIYEFRRNKLCTKCYTNKYYREVRRFRENRKPKTTGDEIVRHSDENRRSQDKEPACN